MRLGVATILSLILVPCALVGCAQKPSDPASVAAPGNAKTVPANLPKATGSQLGPLLASDVQTSEGAIANFSLAQVRTVGNDVFVAFLFNKSTARYEGLAYLREEPGPKYTVEYAHTAQVAHGPYTFQQISGNLTDSPNTYSVTGGYVSQSNVLAVQIVYAATAATVILGKDRMFMDVQIGLKYDPVKEAEFLGAGNRVLLVRK